MYENNKYNIMYLYRNASGENIMTAGKSFVAALAFCGLVPLAIGGEAGAARLTGLTAQFAACMDKSGGVTASMIDCIGTETQRQDVRLNKVYKEVMAQLAPARKKQLLQAQRTWLKFRQENCNFYDDPDGGTLARVNANECFMSATAARATELESFR